jgi:hypothetical protein
MMRSLRFVTAIAMSCLCLTTSLHAVLQNADPRKSPETAVKEGIRLLEAKKYADFLRTFAQPSELEELLASRSLEELGADYGERRAPDMLAALRAAAAMKPTLTQDGSRAEYRFEKPFGRERRISMQKIGEFWYFR